MMIYNLPSQHVSRVFILPVATFDYLKRYQRALNTRTNLQHDNSQVIAQLLSEHMEHIGLTGKPNTAPNAALLMHREAQR